MTVNRDTRAGIDHLAADDFRALLETGREPIAVLGVGGVIRYASPAWAALLGESPEELQGRSLFDRLALFVSHGSHASVSQTLLQGVAQLIAPIFLEQEYTGRRVVELGAGRMVTVREESYAEPVRALLADPACRDAARRFAALHAAFDPARSAQRFRETVNELPVGRSPES